MIVRTLYQWIDRVWQWISRAIFVRFEFDIDVNSLRPMLDSGRVVFAIPYGGIIEWLILSSWCRSQGVGAILVANRKRILLLAKPQYFFQIVLRRRTFAELFLSEQEGLRLLICPSRERTQLFTPTPSERLLSDLYTASRREPQQTFHFVTVVIRWRRHLRGTRDLSEYLFGLSSRPNLIGKIWYLVRRRRDSVVRALAPFPLFDKDMSEGLELWDEGEAMRAAKHVRRRILVLYHQEMRVVLGPRFQPVYHVKESIIRDPEIQDLIAKISSEKAVDRKKLMSLAYRNLTEIVAIYRYRFIEVMYVVLNWFFTRVFEGIVTDEGELQMVRELMKTKAIVLLPCHRSHLDYMVIPYVLFLNDMVTPHVAAGVNLKFWPVSRYVRMGGGFYIRRSFRGDELYSLCLKKYVQFLLKNRYNVTFFLEGTRSRTGKMLPPAYGLLKMVMESYYRGICDDIALVPVSICYDEVPEEVAYVKELGGSEKPKESASELIKSREITKRNIGKVYVRFAPAVLAKEVASVESASDQKPLVLQKVAFQVCKRINDMTPVTPKSIVASILLSHRAGTLALEDVLRLGLMLAGYVEASGYALSVGGQWGLRRAMEQVIRRLQKNGVINVSAAVPRTYFCENRKRIHLNYYKNNGIHCFIIPSITLLSYFLCFSKKGGVGNIPVSEIIEKAKVLRNLLKFEFFFSPTAEFVNEVRQCLSYFFASKGNSVIDLHECTIDQLKQAVSEWNDLSVYLRLVGDLLESYLSTLRFVRETLLRSGDKKSFIQKIMKDAERKGADSGFSFPECVSVQNISNAIMLLNNQGVLRMDRSAGKTVVSYMGWNPEAEVLYTAMKEFFEILSADVELLISPEKSISFD